MASRYMPISISLADRRCLVVGGGEIALRKIETLLDYECRITVVAPDPVEKTEYFARKGRLTLERREYRSPEASQYDIVISASNNSDVNRKVREDCGNAGVLVNVVDDPRLCDFIFPAVVKRDCLTVSVSTDGKAPFLAGHLRLILEDIFPDRWSKIARIAVTYRKQVRRRWRKEPGKQAKCYDRFIQANWAAILKSKSDDEIDQELIRLLDG